MVYTACMFSFCLQRYNKEMNVRQEWDGECSLSVVSVNETGVAVTLQV